ncbi:hypothetical protein [uncultured Herbaspirillum sp.]
MKWHHSSESEPVELYSELDENRYEVPRSRCIAAVT